MRFTMAASSGTMTRSSPSHLYPYTRKCPFGMHCSNRFLVPHFTLSEMLRLSSWANEARMESISSPSSSIEWMFSRSNHTSTPISFRCLTVSNRSILAYAMRTLSHCFICGHVHDELIIEARKDVSVQALCDQMGRTPSWIPGLLLRADGYECGFSKKD